MTHAAGQALSLKLAWSLAARAPILVSPAVDEASESIICGTVEGQLMIICPEGDPGSHPIRDVEGCPDTHRQLAPQLPCICPPLAVRCLNVLADCGR